MKKTIATVAATTIIATSALSSQAFADTYKVKSGDSLWTIANKYQTSVSSLKSLNNLNSDIIFPNQVITVNNDTGKTSTPTTTKQTTTSTSTKTYTIKSGDTLSAIASKYNVSVANLQSWNNISSYLIFPGDVIKVTKPSGSATSNTSNQSTASSKKSTSTNTNVSTYKIQSGDTLSTIASKFNVSVANLKSWNNLTSDLIFAGQSLSVKGTTKSTTTTKVTTTDNTSKDKNVIGTNMSYSSTSDSSASVQKLISVANSFTGTPYVFGGSNPAGFDCSGFVYYVLNKAGYNISRTSSEGFYDRSMYVNTPQVGDLVFFSNTYKSGISHIGIFVGNNSFISATSSGVETVSLSNPYWKSHFDSFKRLYSMVD